MDFYFDVNHEMKKIINNVKFFKLITGLAFKRPNNSKIKNHDMLITWKKRARQQGYEYIEKYLAKPRKTLLEKLETQINRKKYSVLGRKE